MNTSAPELTTERLDWYQSVIDEDEDDLCPFDQQLLINAARRALAQEALVAAAERIVTEAILTVHTQHTGKAAGTEEPLMWILKCDVDALAAALRDTEATDA